jgi:hypothetical protein
VAAALVLLGALPASAGATILYENSPGGQELDPGEMQDVAFTPTTSGTARTMSVTAQTFLNTTGRYVVEIRAPGPTPGQVLATGEGTADDSSGSTLECMDLDNDVPLTVGTQYWLRFRPLDVTTFWNYVRIDDVGCDPHAVTIPVPGGPVDDMYARPGGTAFQTISVGNDGLETLTLTGHTFTGPNAGSFRVLDGEPTGMPPGQPFTYPEDQGPGTGVIFLYVTCDGMLPEGIRTATLNLSTNDPTQPTISWPVECLVDGTPPSIEYTPPATNAAGWSRAKPTVLRARGVDPESGNRVIRIFCSGSIPGEDLDFDSGSFATFNLQTDGVHNIDCQATDAARNTSDPGLYPITVKVDGTQPDTTKDSGPAALTNATSADFTFTASDVTSGVETTECSFDGAAWATCTNPQTRSGLEEGDHRFKVRATDVAGNVETSPATWSWRVDITPPTAVIDEHPPAYTREESATFAFRAVNPGPAAHDRFECRLGDGEFETCTSPHTVGDLELEKEHSFEVRSIDVLGNVQAPPTEFRWTVSHKPLAVDDSASTDPDTPVDVAVLTNDIEPLGGPLSIHSFAATTSEGGTVTQAPAGLLYTPAPGFVGTDTFVYSVRNGVGVESRPAIVTVAVGLPDVLAPVISRLKVKAKKRRVKFVASEAATVTAKIKRSAGKRAKRKPIKLTRQATVGPNTIKLPKRLRGGRYKITLRAADEAGNRSKAISKRFRLKKR